MNLTVTKDFLRHLKNAKAVVFHSDNVTIWRDYKIENETIAKYYVFVMKPSEYEKEKSFCFHVSGWSGNLQALQYIIKENDKIKITMYDDNGSDITNTAGLYRDELHVTIKRKEKYIVKDFVLTVEISKDNTARPANGK